MPPTKPGRSTRRAGWTHDKQHEGWVEYYSFNSRTWNRFLMTLDDQVLYLTFVDRSGQRVLAKQISLGDEPRIEEYPGSYAFELVTNSETDTNSQQRHLFQFRNENDRDLWKAFILGVTTGVVPDDIRLLPGQLIDLRETVRNARPTPPPRQTILPQSEGNTHNVYAEPAGPGDLVHTPAASTESTSATASNNADRRTGSSSDLDTSDADPDAGINGEEESNATSLLMQRTTDLNSKILATVSKKSTFSPSRLQQFSPSFSPVTAAVTSSPPQRLVTGFQPNHTPLQSATVAAGYQPNDSHVALEQIIQQMSSQHFNNNNDVHPFYLEPERNRVPPSWFVDCDRSKAEVILTLAGAGQYGNVLMRPSTASSVNGKYVITMRTDISGGSHLSHYAVVHSRNGGFKIDVDNEQHAMHCLSDVMDFFVESVGRGYARPLRQIGSVRVGGGSGGGGGGGRMVTREISVPLRAGNRSFSSSSRSSRECPGRFTTAREPVSRHVSCTGINDFSTSGAPTFGTSGITVLNRPTPSGASALIRRPSAAMFIAPDSVFNVRRLPATNNNNACCCSGDISPGNSCCTDAMMLTSDDGTPMHE